VRDRGVEFCAEMTPEELRLLEDIRQLPKEAAGFFDFVFRSSKRR